MLACPEQRTRTLVPAAASATTPLDPSATASAPAVPSATRATPAAPSATRATPVAASATASPDADPFAADAEKPELASPDLTERARHLFEAIVSGEPERGDDFFFPRAPFLPLKDVADPGRYFDQLLATYHRDIRELHRRQRPCNTARFVSFELGTNPSWVAPGREYNKIGYYRTFHGKLRWANEGSSGTIDVTTIISYQGRWYTTHLAPIRH